jgi:beta-lactamase class D
MKKIICLLIIVFIFPTIAFASTPDFKKIFKDKDACFILFDLSTNKNVITYNHNRCNERLPTCSTFKIPIALMAFDQKILQDENTVIKWDKINREAFPSWNQDQTPKSWLQNSTIWVSQRIIPQIGMNKIKKYLSTFAYGNQDMSGGLTKAWLSSTLKISAYEQMNFLKNFWEETLPISSRAIILTKKCLPKEITNSGNILYGKAGTGYVDNGQTLGWFVGYLITSDNHQYVFVTNFSDLKHKSKKSASPGARAKNCTKEILQKMHL